jgi:thiazole/oxazole-forming peptide maturase SagD family component
MYCQGCSNGNASGNNLEEAILQGFFELVERDCVALWWYNMLNKRGVDMESFSVPYLTELREYMKSINREIWALDITSDLGIPAFAAFSRRVDQKEERILFGFGCHLDARIALTRAVTEMNQMLGMDSTTENTDDDKAQIEDDETIQWLKNATIENQPYTAPDRKRKPMRFTDFPQKYSRDLLKDILYCKGIIEKQGMEMLALDQTRPDIGVSVAKVIVPGLRHFWARYAPGRLYDVPVKMGWMKKPLKEKDLNPIPMFL